MHVEIIFLLATLLFAISYLFHNIIVLRLVCLVAANVYFIGVAIAGFSTPGIKETFIWAALIVVFNLIHILYYLMEKRTTFLPPDLKPIYKQLFNNMTTLEFKKFFMLGAVSHKSKCLLIENNTEITELILILRGEAEVHYAGEPVATLSQYQFIGEMSLLSGNPTTGDVVVNEYLEYITWDKSKLEKIRTRDPKLYIKIMDILGKDIIGKLIQAHTAN